MSRQLHLPVIFLFFLVMAACGRADTDQAATNSSSPTGNEADNVPASTGYYFSIDEVGLGSNGYVTLTNFTDVAASLARLALCQGSDCFELPDVVVGPGETARIAVGDGSGYEKVVATDATIGELRPLDGEIALLTSDLSGDLQTMFVYFQWGSTPHDLTQTAIEAGLWIEGGYGPSGESATRLYRDQDSGLWLWE